VTPTQASAIRNGTVCDKEKKILRVGAKLYRCANNPLVKVNQLTWTRQECLRVSALLKDAREEYEMWKDDLIRAGSAGEKPLADFQSTLFDLEKTQKSFCKRGA
jgi:hypothetical protein